MKSKRIALLLGLGLTLIANIEAFWFGKSFKLGFAVFVVSAFLVLWLLVRRRKARLLCNLMNAERETQDAALAGLDEADRREILRKLGRDS